VLRLIDQAAHLLFTVRLKGQTERFALSNQLPRTAVVKLPGDDGLDLNLHRRAPATMRRSDRSERPRRCNSYIIMRTGSHPAQDPHPAHPLRNRLGSPNG